MKSNRNETNLYWRRCTSVPFLQRPCPIGGPALITVSVSPFLAPKSIVIRNFIFFNEIKQPTCIVYFKILLLTPYPGMLFEKFDTSSFLMQTTERNSRKTRLKSIVQHVHMKSEVLPNEIIIKSKKVIANIWEYSIGKHANIAEFVCVCE